MKNLPAVMIGIALVLLFLVILWWSDDADTHCTAGSIENILTDCIPR